MRKLKNNFRIVVQGTAKKPTRARVEYQVVDGDMREQPQNIEFDDVNFSSSLDDQWNNVLDFVKNREGL